MKKTTILAAFAALISLASCQKEEVIDNGTDKKASPVFTASIAGATKTTIDLTNGKVAWEEADEITVTDAAKNSATYTIESIDATTGKATFAIKSGETALGAGPYTATYGTEPATVQFYSETAGKLYMTAPETSSNSFTFTVKCGLMKLNLTSPDESVKSIAVTSSTDATYTLTCDPAQSIASSKDFFIALPAGSYKKIEITNSSDVKATLNSTNGVTIAANHIKPVTFGESKLTFTPAVPDGALSGVFSVSANKKVHFSKGNLWYGKVGEATEATFNFEDNQYEFHGYDSANDTWGLFGWVGASSTTFTSAPQIYGISTSQTKEDYGTSYSDALKADWGEAIDNKGTWRTPTKDEWDYLLNTRSASTVGETANARYAKATVNSKQGLILLPDTYAHPSEVTALTVINTSNAYYTSNKYDLTAWKKMESAGAVFLPAAGRRDGSSVTLGQCYYWASTPHVNSNPSAVCVFVLMSGVTVFRNERYCGCSVRLVTNVE